MPGEELLSRMLLTNRILLLFGYILCWYGLNFHVHDIFTARRNIDRPAVDAILRGKGLVTDDTQALPIVSFPSFYRPTCDQMWRGDFAEEFLLRNASLLVVVVSFCKGELDTLFRNLQDISIQRVVVYSKCGDRDIPAHFLERFEGLQEDKKTIVLLPNVGRVDHNVAHYIVNYSTALAVDDVVLFIKDNYHVIHQHSLNSVTLSDMVRLAAGDLGFACGLIPRLDASRQFSAWHETIKLRNFQMEEYKSGAASYAPSDTQDFSRNETLGQWLDSLQIKLPAPLTPVCYGGNFAVRSAHLHAARNAAKRIELSLRRGDNIIEGHFAERTWAGLLMAEIPSSLSNALVSMHTKVSFSSPVMPGMLVGCS